METKQHHSSELKKSCVNCGAELLYAPGTTELQCDYCGYSQEIPKSESGFEELELKPYLETLGSQSHSMELTMIACKNCGATQHIEENYKSLQCVYCGSPLILQDQHTEEWILPGAIIPFQIHQDKAHQIFKKWVDGLWWAPNNLKKASLSAENTKGLYCPYWTFDAQLKADYSGQRGDYYYVTRPYTTRVNGRTVTKMRQERKTRWTPAYGSISGFVDDTLVEASKQRSGKIPSKVARWNLQALQDFNNSYLAGFITEKYTIPLRAGHLEAKNVARDIAEVWVRRDIGGDTQRITSMDMQLYDETFKHILLPVYISTYFYKGKAYHFYVNGQNGTIVGERPYSFWKIFLFVVFILLIIAVIAVIANG